MSPGLFRLTLAVIVMIHHSFPLRLGSWAVGLFFALSGYWIARMWSEKYSRLDRPYEKFLLSRWWRLAPLFIVIHLIAAFLSASGQPVGNGDVVSNTSWWATLPLIAGSAQVDRLLPPAWSLDVEMQFYVIAPLLIGGMAMFGRRAVGLIVISLLAWSFLRLSIRGSLEAPQVDLYAWIFVAGAACAQFDLRPKRKIVVASSLLVVLGIMFVYCFPETRPLVWLRGQDTVPVSTMAKTGFFVFLVIAGLPFAINTVYQKSGLWDRWLGDLSYPLYLFHWLPRDYYYANIDWSQPTWYKILLLASNFGASILGAVLLLQFVDRPLQRLRRGWMERSPDELRPRKISIEGSLAK